MTREELIETVEKYRPTVFRVAFGYTGNYEDSEDISQDVFLKLYQTDKNFKDEEHKKAWIIRVTINAAKSLLRTSWRVKRADMPTEDVPYYSDTADSELFDCVMRLTEKYRTVVYLYYYEDYSVEQVAKIVGISRTAVTTRLARAREQLKKTYTNNEKEGIINERRCFESL